MWILTKFLLAGAIILFWFQNATPNPSEKKNLVSAATTAKTSADTAATVAPAQAVITVHGVCEESRGTAEASQCTTVMTRERFEALLEALRSSGQSLPPNPGKSLAKSYAEYVAVEAAARKAGIEDTPQFRELMNWVRLRAITDLYRHNLQEKLINPPQQDIDAYYQEHLTEYERVRLIRILLPRENPFSHNKDEFEKKAREAAGAARESLIMELDPAQIQKDAYAALGLASPPPTDLGNRRRAELLPEEAAEIFALKPGQVTQVKTEPKNYVVYKVVNRDTQPRDQVKMDISRTIFQQKFKDAMKKILDSAPAEYDEHYLETATPATPSKASTIPSSPSAH